MASAKGSSRREAYATRLGKKLTALSRLMNLPVAGVLNQVRLANGGPDGAIKFWGLDDPELEALLDRVTAEWNR